MRAESRRLLLSLLRHALDAVDGFDVVQRALRERRRAPRGLATRATRWRVHAIGKAAVPMWRGAQAVLGSSIGGGIVVAQADIGGHAAALQAAGAELRLAAHPLPDESSLAAGRALLADVEALPSHFAPLFLVSGGASSLAEAPRAGVTLEQLRAVAARGLAGGVPIDALNRERAALSALKAGGLTRALGGREALALFLSDVPRDDPAVIGSGLLAAVPGDQVERHIVGSVGHAMQAIAAAAAASVSRVEIMPGRLAGEAAEQGERIALFLRDAGPGLYVWGGETTVTLPPVAGRGGRNQHLALAAARGLAGDPQRLLLACGTDGVDGQSDDAGALVDGGSWQRARDGGCDPHAALERADSGAALEAAGDLVHTGPTGTNVGDIVMGLKLS